MPDFSAPTRLTSEHNVSGFTCGKLALDEFIQSHALDKQNAMLSRTYVVTSPESAVIAYYTLANISVTQADLPKKLSRGMPSTIPALLLARLAVDHSYQGRGLGRSLFGDALVRTWSVMKHGPAPVRFFVVDAIDEEAQLFYLQMNMRPSPVNPLRLFLLYKDLRTAFEPLLEDI